MTPTETLIDIDVLRKGFGDDNVNVEWGLIAYYSRGADMIKIKARWATAGDPDEGRHLEGVKGEGVWPLDPVPEGFKATHFRDGHLYGRTPGPHLREVVRNMMIRLRSMGPCSIDGLRSEVATQTIDVDRSNCWEWTARGIAFLFVNGMVEQYDEIFDAYVPTDDWYDGELDAMLDELIFEG